MSRPEWHTCSFQVDYGPAGGTSLATPRELQTPPFSGIGGNSESRLSYQLLLDAFPILAFTFLLSIRHCGNSRLSLWK
jgi:hypothetical protein